MVLAFFHSTIDPTVVTMMITVGVVLIGAALIGTGLEAAGVKVPAIQGWRRQLAVGLFGLAIAALGIWSNSAEEWLRELKQLESDSVHVPPYPEATLQDELGRLAVRAGKDPTKNCELANFISDHSIPLPLIIKRQLNQAQNSDNPALQCYRDITSGAIVAVNNVHKATLQTSTPAARPSAASTGAVTLTPAPPAESVPASKPLALEQPKLTASTRILKASTAPGETGWMYLGALIDSSTLSQNRSVFEQHVNLGQAITTTTDVNLHDATAQNNFSVSQIVGIVPRNSQVLTQQLSTIGGRYLWAKVQLVHNGDTDATATSGGVTYSTYGCPLRTDKEALRGNDVLWIILGTKPEATDRLSNATIDAYCVPRKGETVTVIAATKVYRGWDPRYDHIAGHDPLTPTGETLAPMSRVQVSTGLGALSSPSGTFIVYAPINVISTPHP